MDIEHGSLSTVDLGDDDTNDLMTEDESNSNAELLTSDDSVEGLAADPEPGTSAEVKEEKNWQEAVDISTHVTTTIGGVNVTFPFQPYPIQKAYMSKVLTCIKNVSHSLVYCRSSIHNSRRKPMVYWKVRRGQGKPCHSYVLRELGFGKKSRHSTNLKKSTCLELFKIKVLVVWRKLSQQLVSWKKAKLMFPLSMT